MPKAQLKTAQNDFPPAAFIAAVENPRVRADAGQLLALFNRVTALQPKMWGDSIIGYGRYHYRYASGREGEFFITGFSPRRANSTVYIMLGYRDLSAQLARLGKHKTGKSCLYINKLSDINLKVLEQIIRRGVRTMRANYQTFDL